MSTARNNVRPSRVNSFGARKQDVSTLTGRIRISCQLERNSNTCYSMASRSALSSHNDVKVVVPLVDRLGMERGIELHKRHL